MPNDPTHNWSVQSLCMKETAAKMADASHERIQRDASVLLTISYVLHHGPSCVQTHAPFTDLIEQFSLSPGSESLLLRGELCARALENRPVHHRGIWQIKHLSALYKSESSEMLMSPVTTLSSRRASVEQCPALLLAALSYFFLFLSLFLNMLI